MGKVTGRNLHATANPNLKFKQAKPNTLGNCRLVPSFFFFRQHRINKLPNSNSQLEAYMRVKVGKAMFKQLTPNNFLPKAKHQFRYGQLQLQIKSKYNTNKSQT